MIMAPLEIVLYDAKIPMHLEYQDSDYLSEDV